MIINDKEYIKVRDAQEGETGWAYYDEDGKVILDNEFERIPLSIVLLKVNIGNKKVDIQINQCPLSTRLTKPRFTGGTPL